MSEMFLKIINMSISASYIVLAVLLLRLLLKKAPKWITVVLWGIVAVRLVCPFSIESVLSLIPSSEVVSPDIMMDRTPEINTGIPIINQVINPVISGSFTPDPGTSANPLQLWIPTFAVIWIVGMVALLIYTVISYVKVKRKIGTAVLLRENIYQSENVVSPFVLGIIKPKIYLPFNMNEKDVEHVVAHEMAHIRRKDHLWKPLGFLLLTLHWFNPLMWLGYVLLCRDIELACDEKVIGELDHDARADYSQALLTCSVNRRMIAACPLAFGEVGVKDRVKSVLNYKKPAFWIIIAAVVACVVLAVCFLTNPPQKDDDTMSPHGDIYTDYEGVYITIKSIDKDEGGQNIFNIVWHNETDKEITYGEMYTVEYKVGEEWMDTDFDEERYFNTIGYSLRKNKTASKSYTAEHLDISKRGTYRFMVPFSVKEGDKYVSYKTWAEFTVGNDFNLGASNLIYGFVPPASDSDKLSYIYISALGCGVKDVKINFEKARFEDGKLIFDIHWTNEGSDNIDIGPDFEVYKYNGSTLEKLDHNGVWLYYREILSGKGMTVDGNSALVSERSSSYAISEHYDVLTPGIYRFEAHGSWVEFQIIDNFNLISAVYDQATFDVDGDGKEENCSLLFGRTSGLFTFIFFVQDKETGEVEYETTIYSQVYELSFQKGADGVTRVQGITREEEPETHLFDISIKDGYVNLTENGVPIGEIN